MIVVDTNILVHALVEGPRTEFARRLKELEPAWRVPALWRWEFTNVLWFKVRTGGMRREEATSVLAQASRRFEPLERPVSMEEALDAALEFSISGYDGAFVALAKRNGTKLVTEDQKLCRASKPWACSAEDFLK